MENKIEKLVERLKSLTGGGNDFNPVLDNSLSVVAHNNKNEKAATLIGFTGSLERLNHDLKDGLDKSDVTRFIDNVSYDVAGLEEGGINWRMQKLLNDSKNTKKTPASESIERIKNNKYTDEDILNIIRNIQKHSDWL